jgi:uncharacterized protein YcgI (DUF1989 family)
MAQERIENTYDEDIDPVKTYERKVAPNKAFYDRVVATKENGTRTLVYEDINAPHTGNAYFVKAGQVIRMEQRPSLRNGRTQIIDVLFITPDLKQISDHLNTGALEGLNPRLYSGVWTQSGYLEKIATLVADDFPYERLPHDKVGHIFFAAHCNAEWITLAHGAEANVNSCHENFIHGFLRLPAVQAIEDEQERRQVALSLADHNDINIFQGQQFAQDERGITRCVLFPSPSVPDGTGVEFYAEKDIYTVISNCPYADQALPFPEAKPNPVYISVWETGIKPETNHLGLPPASEWQELAFERIATKDTSPK